jgi:signal transduction histidine kinase
VNRAGTHLLGLINQVLDLSKIEAGKLELNPQTVQLAPLINDVIGTAAQLAEQNKNRLVVDAQENLGTLTAAPRLRRVDISVERAGRIVVLRIADNGNGLPRKVAEQCFRRPAAGAIHGLTVNIASDAPVHVLADQNDESRENNR